MARDVKAKVTVEVDTKKGQSAIDTFAARFKNAFSGVGLATAVATKGLDLVQGALSSMTGAFKEAIALANEQERQQRRLAAALSLQGEATQENIEQIDAFNSALQQRLGIGDEQLLQTESTLLALGIERSRLQEATKATIGLAQITGDLASASRLVGRALQGETSALTRYGIKADSVAEVQDKLNELFTLAEAQAGSYATQSNRLSANIGDLGEALGELITKNPDAIEGTSRLADATKGLELSIRDARTAWEEFTITRDEFIEKDLPGFVGDANEGFQEFGTTIIGAITGFGAVNSAIDQFANRSKIATENAKELSQELADISVLQAKGGFFPTEKEIEESVKRSERGFKRIQDARRRAAEKEVAARIQAEDEIEAASREASMQMQRDTEERINAELEAIQEQQEARRQMIQSLADFRAQLEFDQFIADKERREAQLEERASANDAFIQEQNKQFEDRQKQFESLGANIQGSIASGFSGAILAGEGFGDAMEALALRIASSFLEQGILSLLGGLFGGPLGIGGGLLGGLFGGLFAKGGRVGPMGEPIRAQRGTIIRGGTAGVDSVLVAAQEGEAFLPADLTRELMRVLGQRGGASFAGGGMVGAGGAPSVVVQSLVFPTRSQFQRATRDELGPSQRRARRRGIKT